MKNSFSIFDWKKSELIFVAVVLFIGFGISAFQLSLGEIKTRDAQRKADGELVTRALRVYYEQHDAYPLASGGKIVACGGKGGDVCEWGGGPVTDDDGVVYLQKIPQDPFAYKGGYYTYEVLQNLQGVRIYAALENKRDVDVKEDLTTNCGKNVQCNWYVEN